ncbi:Efflux transporter [Bosea sp. LC85]|uniref:HlyD family type I secretion periplasmic adaptor subunit n=1 Tax=Bosea sp. LC85 TaxID=1502851 RepID=UPI0004E2CF8E|nr:HlyD family type I secretion periplasmic adaptor subunit [Bosea sp. LC85]KFC71645.1 Efflux transporter [Bosea sp. LC85]
MSGIERQFSSQRVPARRVGDLVDLSIHPTSVRARLTLEQPRSNAKGLILCGSFLALALLGGAVTWAVAVPLASAVIAPGVVKVLSQRRAVQHLEGGIVKAVFVREGDHVERGQPVARLDTTQIEANLGVLRAKLFSDLAQEARLEAEQSDSKTISFSGELQSEQSQPDARLAMETQRTEFAARSASIGGQRTLIAQQLLQQEAAIRGLQGSSEGLTRQLHFLRDEIVDSDYLLAKGLARKPKVLALKRAEAEAEAQLAANAATIAQAKGKISELEDKRRQIGFDWFQDIAQQRRAARERIADARHRIAAAQDMLERSEIRAPETGTIVGLNTRHSNAVLAPRETLLEIVPTQDRLIVEGEVKPTDRNEVRLGQSARVKVLAFNSRRSPELTGLVTMITADALVDQASGRSFYKSEVDLALSPDLAPVKASLQAGMPVEIFIETGHRTFGEYLIEPLMLRVSRAFKEK